MKFRFIGQYTNGHTSIVSNGVTFVGREPSEAEGEAVAKLQRHPEFEVVKEAKTLSIAQPKSTKKAAD